MSPTSWLRLVPSWLTFRTTATALLLAMLVGAGAIWAKQDNVAAKHHINQEKGQLKPAPAIKSKGMDWIAALTLVAIGGQVWVAWRQTGVMNRQARIYDRQADLMEGQLAATKTAADASVKASESTATQAELAKTALYSLERPRIYPTGLVYDPASASAMISFSFKNYGRSPAILKSCSCILSIWPTNNITKKLMHERRPFMIDGLIGENDTLDPLTFSHPAITQHRNNIETGITSLAVCVSVEYEDLFGTVTNNMMWFVWHRQRGKFVAGLQVWDA